MIQEDHCWREIGLSVQDGDRSGLPDRQHSLTGLLDGLVYLLEVVALVSRDCLVSKLERLPGCAWPPCLTAKQGYRRDTGSSSLRKRKKTTRRKRRIR